MKSIETLEEFEQMLALDKCLIFVAASWSQPSEWSRKRIEAYEIISNSTIFEMDIDKGMLTEWLFEQSDNLNNTLCLSGAGSLLFVERGTATDHVLPNGLNISQLSLKIQRFFDYENHQNPAAG